MKFREYRKSIPLNEFIYIQVNHTLKYTTLKATGRAFDKYYVERVGELGQKKWIVLHWYKEGDIK